MGWNLGYRQPRLPRLSQLPGEFEAGTEHRVVFEVPDRVRGDTNPLGKPFLRELQLEAQATHVHMTEHDAQCPLVCK